MNLKPNDYQLLAAIAQAGTATRVEIQKALRLRRDATAGFNRLRKAGLIEVAIEAGHKNWVGEGEKRRPTKLRHGQAVAHRWSATEDGRLLSGTL